MPRTTLRIETHGSSTTQAVLVIPGYANHGDFVVAELLEFLQRSDKAVKVVNYGDPGFDATEVVEAIIQSLRGFTEVVIIGQSLGSIIAKMVVDQIVSRKIKIQVSVIAVAGITDSSDVVMPIARLIKFYYWPLTSRPLNRFIRWMSDKFIMKVQVEPNVDRPLLKRHWRSLWQISGKARRAQLGFMARTSRDPANTHDDIPSVYIRGMQNKGSDRVVFGSAADGWRAVFPRTRIIDGLVNHGTLVEQPKAYAELLADAFVELDLQAVE